MLHFVNRKVDTCSKYGSELKEINSEWICRGLATNPKNSVLLEHTAKVKRTIDVLNR